MSFVSAPSVWCSRCGFRTAGLGFGEEPFRYLGPVAINGKSGLGTVRRLFEARWRDTFADWADARPATAG